MLELEMRNEKLEIAVSADADNLKKEKPYNSCDTAARLSSCEVNHINISAKQIPLFLILVCKSEIDLQFERAVVAAERILMDNDIAEAVAEPAGD